MPVALAITTPERGLLATLTAIAAYFADPGGWPRRDGRLEPVRPIFDVAMNDEF